MEIVIKINEDAYNLLEQKYRNGKADALDCIILNGNVLPKGHGRLIDANELEEMKEPMYESNGDMKGYGVLMNDIREFAPTIIEADRR